MTLGPASGCGWWRSELEPGWAAPGEDPYRLPRLRVLGGTSAQSLLAEIAAIRNDPPPPSSYGGA